MKKKKNNKKQNNTVNNINQNEEIKKSNDIEENNEPKVSDEIRENKEVKTSDEVKESNEEKGNVKDEKEKKSKKEKKPKDENRVKLNEKVSLSIRKKWLVNGTRTLLLAVILILAYIALNLIISTLKLPEIDVTKNKLYSLSDASKAAIEKVNQDVKIYVYGFEENSQLVKFLDKYNKVNEKITYEILTEETNYEKIQENELQAGYTVLILESGESKKVLDASTDFYTVDYTTYQQIDTTEESITNAILSLMVENKPKVYFTEGHNEMSISTGELVILPTYLQNESFEVYTVNLATLSAVPEDCDVLAIMSPVSDFFDVERDMILDYISKGGKIYCSIDPMPTSVEMPNIKTILGQFGVSVQNGRIIELAQNSAVTSAPYIFTPRLSTTSNITKDIYSSAGAVWLANSARLQFESEETLQTLNVVKEDLLTSSESSVFVTDLSIDLETAMATAEAEISTISSKITKTIAQEGENVEDLQAALIITANGMYISEYVVSNLSANYPMSYIANNKDFAINCMAELAEKEGLTIRKEASAAATYVPNDTEKIVVKSIIFGAPVLIIIIGIVIWSYRKKRK